MYHIFEVFIAIFNMIMNDKTLSYLFYYGKEKRFKE